MKRTLTAAALAALVAGPALAQDAMDTNADGMYSMEELMAAFPEMTPETFATADVNADGTLDAEELAQAQADGLIPATEG
jgi:opacity protein-like surface antigen